MAAFASSNGTELSVTALVALPDGSRFLRDTLAGDPNDADRLGEQLASQLIASGAREILETAEAMNG